MSSDRSGWPKGRFLSYWQRLEQDWQSVAVATSVVAATILLEIQVPW
ncbi:hypothetical protein [Natronosalvus vescus]|nr:hypothetical protein [Natronosalvus vescus]